MIKRAGYSFLVSNIYLNMWKNHAIILTKLLYICIHSFLSKNIGWSKDWYLGVFVSFVKFLRTPFLQNTSGGCFYKIRQINESKSKATNIWYSLENCTSTNTTTTRDKTIQQNLTRVQDDTIRDNTRATWDIMSTTRNNKGTTWDSTSTKQHEVYFDLFMPSLHTWNLVHQTVKLRKLKVAFSSNS